MGEGLRVLCLVRVTARAGTGDIILGVCCRPPDQKDEAGEAVYGQIEAASPSQGLVFMGDCKHPDICWKRKSDKNTMRPAGKDKMLLDKLRQKKEAYRRWKQGHVV